MEDFQSTGPVDLLTLAVRNGLLPSEDAEALAREAERRELSAEQWSVQEKRLTGRQVDALRKLQAPTAAAPGYELTGLIGMGGMGTVYRAKQLSLDRLVAIKLLDASVFVDSTAVARFHREAAAIGRLRHQNIVTAHDFGEHQSTVFLVMEHVDGVDLEGWIERNGRLSESDAWQIARQVAVGLAHAARQGVIHRDLKPANVLVIASPEGLGNERMMAKIADFGLALVGSDAPGSRLTAPRAAIGSPCYMAPEQFESSDIDFRADIYGLGATMYHALAGTAPYATMKLAEIIGKKLNHPPLELATARPDVSPATADLVARMMACDPADRPASYEQLLRQIENLPTHKHSGFERDAATTVAPGATQVIHQENVQTRVVSRPSTDRPGRRLRVVIAAVAALLVIAAVGGWAAWRTWFAADPLASSDPDGSGAEPALPAPPLAPPPLPPVPVTIPAKPVLSPPDWFHESMPLLGPDAVRDWQAKSPVRWAPAENDVPIFVVADYTHRTIPANPNSCFVISMQLRLADAERFEVALGRRGLQLKAGDGAVRIASLVYSPFHFDKAPQTPAPMIVPQAIRIPEKTLRSPRRLIPASADIEPVADAVMFVRVSRSFVKVFRRMRDGSESSVGSLRVNLDSNRYYRMGLQRIPGHWRVHFDERLVGGVSRRRP